MARQIVVDIIGDNSRFNRSVDAASGKAGGFRNVLTGIGQGLGQGVFNLAATGIQMVIGSLGEADAAYQEDMRSQGLLRAALENNVPAWNGNTDAIEAQIAAQMRLGFGDEEQRDSLGNLAAITKDVTKAQELQTIAMDLARLKGMDLATASDLVGKVSAGNLGTLSRYGIVLGENATKEEALAAIQQMAGGQAQAYAEGPLGIQEAAQLRVGESMERIGSVVNQVSSAALPILADAFANVVDWLMNTWTAIEPGVKQLVTQLMPAIKNVVTAIIAWQTILFNVAKVVIPPVWAAVNFLGQVVGNVFSAIAGFVRTHIGTVTNVVNGVRTVFSNVVKWVVDTKDGIVGAFNGIVSFITGMPGKITRAAGGMFNGIWNAFKGAINSIIRGWNSLQFTMPEIDLGPMGTFGGFTIGVPKIPYLHAGGIVPGVPGSDVAAILQAGERVIPARDAGRGGDVHIHIASFIGSDNDIDRFADRLAMRVRLAQG